MLPRTIAFATLAVAFVTVGTSGSAWAAARPDTVSKQGATIVLNAGPKFPKLGALKPRPKAKPSLSNLRIVESKPLPSRVPSVRAASTQSSASAARGQYALSGKGVGLRQRLAGEVAARSASPQYATRTIMRDSRWPAEAGWKKMVRRVEPSELTIPASRINPATGMARRADEVHFVWNSKTRAVDDFKIQVPKSAVNLTNMTPPKP